MIIKKKKKRKMNEWKVMDEGDSSKAREFCLLNTTCQWPEKKLNEYLKLMCIIYGILKMNSL